MAIATLQEEIEITGDFEAQSLDLLNADGFAVIATAIGEDPTAKTFETGNQQEETITFQDFASTGQNDYVVISLADSTEYAVAIDKVVAQEVQTLTFPKQEDFQSGDFVVLESIEGEQYAVSMDTSLAAEVAQISPASKASTASGDYVAFYSQDGEETYAISLDKTLQAETAVITMDSATNLGNDDWLEITSTDLTKYAVAYDKSLQPQVVDVTFQTVGATGNNDYFALYAKNGAGELSVAVNLDQSLKPEKTELTFLDVASTTNDDWVSISAVDTEEWAVALDKTAAKQDFDLTFVSVAATNDGDFAVMTDSASNEWAFSLDRTGAFAEDQVECKPLGVCVGGDFILVEAIDGTQYAVAINVTGSDPAPTALSYTTIPAGQRTLLDISGIPGSNDIATAIVAAFSGLSGFTSLFTISSGGSSFIVFTQLVAGVEVPAAIWDSTGSIPALSFTLTQLAPGIAPTVPSASEWTSVDVSRKVTISIYLLTTASDVCNAVYAALGSLTGFGAQFAMVNTPPAINFENPTQGAFPIPVTYNEDGTSTAQFSLAVNNPGADVGEPAGAKWAAIGSGQKTVVDISNMTTEIEIAAQVLIQLNALATFSAKITATDPFLDGTLILEQVTEGALGQIPVSWNSLNSGAGSVVVTTLQVGADTTYPTGPLWDETYSAKITVELFGLSSAADIATAVDTALNAVPTFSTYASTSVFGGVITVTNVQSGPALSSPFTKNADDSGPGAVSAVITQAGSNSSAPNGPLWTAIPADQKTVIFTNSTENAIDLCTVTKAALDAIAGFSSKITVTDNFDGTYSLTQLVPGAVANPVPHDEPETGSGVISVAISVPGADAVIPSGAIWASIPGGNKSTIDISSYTTAIEIAAAMASEAITLLAANFTVAYTGGNNYFTTTQLNEGATTPPTPKTYNDGAPGSIGVSLTTPGADATVPTITAWTDVSNRVQFDGRALTTAASVGTAFYDAFVGFDGIETQFILTDNLDGTVDVKSISLGDTPNPIIETYDGLGSPTITSAITIPGGVPSEPTGASWLAVPSDRRVSAAGAGLTTAAEIAAAAKSALEAIPDSELDLTIVDSGSGVLTVTLVVDGPATVPTPHNTGDTGAGSITGAITTLGVVSDVLVSASTITIPSHGYFTGLAVQLSGGTLPSPLSLATTYYVINVSKNVIKLASSNAEAGQGSNIAFEDSGAPNTTFTVTPNAYSMSVKLQASNDGIMYADIPDTTETVAEGINTFFWNIGPVYYEYVRFAGVISGGQATLDYFINARD